MGLAKKMSMGTVRGKSELCCRSGQKSMSSSFFLYKVNGGGASNSKG